MSALIKSPKLVKICFRNNPILMTAVRHHWNKDFKPAPYPRTEEERLKAAEKYGLHPSEYEPYPDDGTGFGDYPKLPDVGYETRDPFYPWDNPELKRNFNEPVHVHFDLVREDRYNLNARLRYSVGFQLSLLLGVLFGAFSLFVGLNNFKMFHPVAPKQLLNDGRKHYTFEPVD